MLKLNKFWSDIKLDKLKRNKIGNKAQINQIFVYLVSIIIIAFAGFMVAKFIFSFGDDVDERANNKFYSDIDADFQSVFRNYGSGEVKTYTVAKTNNLVCFFGNSCNISNLLGPSTEVLEELLKISDSGESIVLLENEIVISSGKISEEFYGCFCEKIIQGKFSLNYENSKNDVYISSAQLVR